MSSSTDPTDVVNARREFLARGVASLTLAAAGPYAVAAPSEQAPACATRVSVNALVFDVFGTVVDWRGSIVREGQLLGERKGIDIDWVAFTDAWRGGYQPAMQRVRSGQIPWTNIDGLHRLVLNVLLRQFGIQGLSDDEIDHFNRAWHR